MFTPYVKTKNAKHSQGTYLAEIRVEDRHGERDSVGKIWNSEKKCVLSQCLMLSTDCLKHADHSLELKTFLKKAKKKKFLTLKNNKSLLVFLSK